MTTAPSDAVAAPKPMSPWAAHALLVGLLALWVYGVEVVFLRDAIALNTVFNFLCFQVRTHVHAINLADSPRWSVKAMESFFGLGVYVVFTTALIPWLERARSVLVLHVALLVALYAWMFAFMAQMPKA